MEKELQEVLKENRERKRAFIKEQIRRQKKEEKKEIILTFIIGVFIIITTILLLNSLDNSMMKDCVSAGYSESYCERGI